MKQYQVRMLTTEDIFEVAHLYADVWESQNLFIKAMGITQEDFYPVALSVTELCAEYSVSVVVVDKESERIVAYALSAPSEAGSLMRCSGSLNPKIRMWMEFNEELQERVTPYLQYLDESKLVHGFACGVHREYTGRGLFRLINDCSLLVHRSHGYKYSISNSVCVFWFADVSRFISLL
eukprot:TRINITY_DN1463_c0_g1_i1.p1 TRINITY_DN1463_c0_g1~~TRINITY_DN1463_c0_g1_i1.p1  ORF type:complete len:207 (-),score=30.14 TRINITY_DN1463_c0_g1_i1:211-747(-)